MEVIVIRLTKVFQYHRLFVRNPEKEQWKVAKYGINRYNGNKTKKYYMKPQ